MASCDQGAGWQVWQGRVGEWPVTTLLAMEAVQAAKEQGLAASEALDRALRVSMFADSGCVSMWHVVLDAAERCAAVDVGALVEALKQGRSRRRLWDYQRPAEAGLVKGSPHVWLPDGTNVANPGIEMHWEGEHGEGYPVVDDDDPSVHEDLIRRAALVRAGPGPEEKLLGRRSRNVTAVTA